jgi:hypothetical protein
MDIETSVLALGFDGYLVALALVARQDIARFGPAMVLGIVAGLGALVCGEIALLDRWESLGVAMALATVASLGLIAMRSGPAAGFCGVRKASGRSRDRRNYARPTCCYFPARARFIRPLARSMISGGEA